MGYHLETEICSGKAQVNPRPAWSGVWRDSGRTFFLCFWRISSRISPHEASPEASMHPKVSDIHPFTPWA